MRWRLSSEQSRRRDRTLEEKPLRWPTATTCIPSTRPVTQSRSMDINKWLEDTIAPERPTLPEKLGLPSFLHPKETVADPPSKHRHPRKLPSSDSSFIEAEASHRSPHLTKRQPSGRRQSNNDRSTGSASRSTSLASEELDAADRYKRRSRRKTRPDLYEPKPEKGNDRRERKHGKEEETSKKTKRKSKRKTKDTSGANLAHSFNATNVSKGRLTVSVQQYDHAHALWHPLTINLCQLKQGASVGLFKKGRASSPVRGRGCRCTIHPI